MLVRAYTPQSHLQSTRILRPYILVKCPVWIQHFSDVFIERDWWRLIIVTYVIVTVTKLNFADNYLHVMCFFFSPHFGLSMSLLIEMIQIYVGGVTRTITSTMAYDDRLITKTCVIESFTACTYIHKYIMYMWFFVPMLFNNFPTSHHRRKFCQSLIIFDGIRCFIYQGHKFVSGEWTKGILA